MAPTGDIYFSHSNDTVWLLPRDAQQPRRFWIAPERITDIAVGPSGTVYVSLSKAGMGEQGRIYAIKAEGRRPRLIAGNLSAPLLLRLDAQENIYVGGAGWSSICLIPATNRNQRLILRGPLSVWVLVSSPDGSIYYSPNDQSGTDLHVLRPKQLR